MYVLRIFVATKFNEVLSGRQPRQGVEVFPCFGNQFCPNLQGAVVLYQMIHATAGL
jgi:hypothetical protein